MKRLGKTKQISNIIFLVKRAWSIRKSMFPIYIVKLVLEAIRPYITIYCSAKILDAVSSGQPFVLALRYILYMVCGNLLLEIFLSIIQVLQIDVQNKTNNRAGCQLMREYMSMDYQYNESGDMLNITQSFFLYVQPAEFLPLLGKLLTGVIQVALSAYIAISIHPIILLALIAFIALKSYLTASNHRREYQWSIDQAPFQRKLGYLKNAMTQMPFAKEVRMNRGKGWLTRKFEDVLYSYSLSVANYCNSKIKASIGIVIVDALQQALIYLYFSYQVIRGSLSIGNLSMMLQVTSLFYSSVNQIYEQLSLLSNTASHVEDYKDYLKLMESGCTAGGWRPVEDTTPDVEIEFRNVSMVYPNTSTAVLNRVSFHIRPGEHVAIVGQNGAGKSTIIKLLCRLYEPTEGEILLNGININEYQYEDYVEHISVILQDFKLLAFPIRENIVLNREFNQELFDYAIAVSNLEEKIESLPEGADTVLFRQYDENGTEFSGGESQRVALAREIYKNGAMILLDEPTSALDALSEYKIFEALNTITRKKTSISISHRLSSVIFCDRIIVINSGNVVEQGDHAALMEQKGEYYTLFTRQAEHYMTPQKEGQ